MIRIVLGNSGKAQYFVFLLFGSNVGDGKVTFCERTRLVKHKDICFAHKFEVVAALDENAESRRRADARKEGKRH